MMTSVMKKLIGLGVAVLIGLAIMADGAFTVEQGERVVVLRTGSLLYVAEPGFHLKIPLIDSTIAMEVRTQKETYTPVVSYSRDIQQSSSVVTVNYELTPANVARVYTQYGPKYADRILRPAVLDKFKEVFGRFTAAEIVGERFKVGDQVFRSIAEEVREAGIIVTAVQIENIDFTDEFEKAIEAAVKAKAEVTQAEQILLRREIEARTVVIQARAAADATRAKAEGDADATVLRGNGEATAMKVMAKAQAENINLRGEALAKNPRFIELESAYRWDGKLPVTMIPGATLPFIDLSRIAQPNHAPVVMPTSQATSTGVK